MEPTQNMESKCNQAFVMTFVGSWLLGGSLKFISGELVIQVLVMDACEPGEVRSACYAHAVISKHPRGGVGTEEDKRHHGVHAQCLTLL